MIETSEDFFFDRNDEYIFDLSSMETFKKLISEPPWKYLYLKLRPEIKQLFLTVIQEPYVPYTVQGSLIGFTVPKSKEHLVKLTFSDHLK